jgi:predicted DsbA family dithiol-disulfide isomerase
MEQVRATPMDRDRPLAFSVMRVPFFLEPGYPEDEGFAETNRARLVRKWGGVAGWEAQKQRHGLKERARSAGIVQPINLDRLASSTMQSHRLVQWVTRTKGLDASERLYDALNMLHFVNGRKLNDAVMLAAAAAEHAGVDEADARRFLASDEGRAQISKALAVASQFGVHSIPKFIIDGALIIDGAAHAEEHVRVFREIERRGTSSGRALFAEALGISPEVLAGEGASCTPPPAPASQATTS